MSTTTQLPTPPSPEVAGLIERLRGMDGLEAVAELARVPWWVAWAVLFHVGRGT